MPRQPKTVTFVSSNAILNEDGKFVLSLEADGSGWTTFHLSRLMAKMMVSHINVGLELFDEEQRKREKRKAAAKKAAETRKRNKAAKKIKLL